MSELCYERIRGLYRLSTLSCDGGTRCGVTISPAENGTLRIGDLMIPVTRGRAVLSLSQLSDGDHTPVLYTGTGEHLLPPLRKLGDVLLSLGERCDCAAALLRTADAVQKETAELARRVAALEEAIHGTAIFTL